MQHAPSAYEVRLAPTEAGWAWRVTPTAGPTLSGQQADLESARRTAAFAAAVLSSLDRARRRTPG